jgi:hypothetical protein
MNMKRKIVLATVLCLAVAALGIGAAPASAAGGCTCHTDEPPTATAAHEPFVASVTDCTSCHLGMTVPHTGLLTMAIFTLDGRSIDAGYRLHGNGYDILNLGHSVKRANVTVYLQHRAPGETVFTDLGQTATNKYGNFGFTVASPVPYACYRAVEQGQIVPSRIALPCIRILTATPTLTLGLRGLTHGAVALGHGVRAFGRAQPTDMAGETVQFKVRKWVQTKWVTLTTAERACSETATYTWTYTAKTRGLYKVRAIHMHSENYNTARSPWRQFRVK